MTKAKSIRKQILQNQILRLAKIICNYSIKHPEFMRAVRLQCNAIKEKKSIK